MNTDELLTLLSLGMESYSPGQIMAVLFAALAGGALIFIVYRITVEDSLYDRRFNEGNVVLTLLTAVIMMMISSNIVISLGMVGALSIVRFRTAVKEARDTIYLFWAIVHGLCAGSRSFVLAALADVFIALVAVVLGLSGRFVSGCCTLVVRGGDGFSPKAAEARIKKEARSCKLRASASYGDETEYVFRVRMPADRRAGLVQTLRSEDGVVQVSLSEVNPV